MKNYSASIALTKLKHVKMKAKGKKGEVEGLFIPIKANYLIEGKENDGEKPVYMNIALVIRDEEDSYGQIGFIPQKGTIDGKKWKELTEEEKNLLKELPILGNIKDWSSNSDDTGGDAGAGQTFGENDDLPF